MYGGLHRSHFLGILLILGIGFSFPYLLSTYVLYVSNMLLTYAILAIGMDLLIGWTGQFAFSHVAFFGIGIYGTTLFEHKLGVPFLFSMLISAVLAGGIGIAIGVPATRLKAVYLALATFAFSECAQWVFRSWDSVTGGSDGLQIRPPVIFGYVTGTDRSALPVIATVFALILAATLYLTRSTFGREMCAVRDSEHVAAASGINVARVKVLSFAISAVYAGIAGGVFTLFQSFVNADVLGSSQLVTVITMVVIGGIGSIPGVLLGVLIMGLLPEILRGMPRFLLVWQECFYGVILVLSIVLMPQGLGGLLRSLMRGMRHRFRWSDSDKSPVELADRVMPSERTESVR
jgi:branched-chain amino acid transport system permease protein